MVAFVCCLLLNGLNDILGSFELLYGFACYFATTGRV